MGRPTDEGTSRTQPGLPLAKHHRQSDGESSVPCHWSHSDDTGGAHNLMTSPVRDPLTLNSPIIGSMESPPKSQLNKNAMLDNIDSLFALESDALPGRDCPTTNKRRTERSEDDSCNSCNNIECRTLDKSKEMRVRANVSSAGDKELCLLPLPKRNHRRNRRFHYTRKDGHRLNMLPEENRQHIYTTMIEMETTEMMQTMCVGLKADPERCFLEPGGEPASRSDQETLERATVAADDDGGSVPDESRGISPWKYDADENEADDDGYSLINMNRDCSRNPSHHLFASNGENLLVDEAAEKTSEGEPMMGSLGGDPRSDDGSFVGSKSQREQLLFPQRHESESSPEVSNRSVKELFGDVITELTTQSTRFLNIKARNTLDFRECPTTEDSELSNQAEESDNQEVNHEIEPNKPSYLCHQRVKRNVCIPNYMLKNGGDQQVLLPKVKCSMEINGTVHNGPKVEDKKIKASNVSAASEYSDVELIACNAHHRDASRGGLKSSEASRNLTRDVGNNCWDSYSSSEIRDGKDKTKQAAGTKDFVIEFNKLVNASTQCSLHNGLGEGYTCVQPPNAFLNGRGIAPGAVCKDNWLLGNGQYCKPLFRIIPAPDDTKQKEAAHYVSLSEANGSLKDVPSLELEADASAIPIDRVVEENQVHLPPPPATSQSQPNENGIPKDYKLWACYQERHTSLSQIEGTQNVVVASPRVAPIKNVHFEDENDTMRSVSSLGSERSQTSLPLKPILVTSPSRRKSYIVTPPCLQQPEKGDGLEARRDAFPHLSVSAAAGNAKTQNPPQPQPHLRSQGGPLLQTNQTSPSTTQFQTSTFSLKTVVSKSVQVNTCPKEEHCQCQLQSHQNARVRTAKGSGPKFGVLKLSQAGELSLSRQNKKKNGPLYRKTTPTTIAKVLPPISHNGFALGKLTTKEACDVKVGSVAKNLPPLLSLGNKNLVCQAWVGPSETTDNAATCVDESQNRSSEVVKEGEEEANKSKPLSARTAADAVSNLLSSTFTRCNRIGKAEPWRGSRTRGPVETSCHDNKLTVSGRCQGAKLRFRNGSKACGPAAVSEAQLKATSHVDVGNSKRTIHINIQLDDVDGELMDKPLLLKIYANGRRKKPLELLTMPQEKPQTLQTVVPGCHLTQKSSTSSGSRCNQKGETVQAISVLMARVKKPPFRF